MSFLDALIPGSQKYDLYARSIDVSELSATEIGVNDLIATGDVSAQTLIVPSITNLGDGFITQVLNMSAPEGLVLNNTNLIVDGSIVQTLMGVSIINNQILVNIKTFEIPNAAINPTTTQNGLIEINLHQALRPFSLSGPVIYFKRLQNGDVDEQFLGYAHKPPSVDLLKIYSTATGAVIQNPGTDNKLEVLGFTLTGYIFP
jgi:hypothetical protein